MIWIFGVVFRYAILFPIRLVLFAIAGIGLVVLTRLVALIPNEWLIKLSRLFLLVLTRIYN